MFLQYQNVIFNTNKLSYVINRGRHVYIKTSDTKDEVCIKSYDSEGGASKAVDEIMEILKFVD